MRRVPVLTAVLAFVAAGSVAGGLAASAQPVAADVSPVSAVPPVAGTNAASVVGKLRLAPSRTTSALLSTVDDRTLTRTGVWTNVASNAAYLRTLSRSTRAGATLTSRTRAVNGGSFLMQAGPGRGTVEIRVNGVRKARVSTAATRIGAKSIAFTGAGVVSIRVVTPGRGVLVDSLRLNAPALSVAPRPNGALTLMGVNSRGLGHNVSSFRGAALSPGGGFLAFWSDATNLEPGVTNGRSHLYLAFTRATKIAGKSYRAGQVIGSIAESADFGAGKLSFAWMPRRPGDADSSKLVFITADRNVIDGDPSPGSGPWAYVGDFVDGTATRLPLQQPSEIVPSPNGKLFAFRTEYRYQQNENNYDDDIWVYDPAAPSNRDLFAVSADVNGNLPVSNGGPTKSTTPVWSPDNQRVAFTSFASLVGSDTNIAEDIYVKNFKTGAITRASTNARGAQANASSGYPAWSPDGTKLAFQSEADNLITTDSNVKSDIFVKVLSTGQIIPVSVSRSGRYPIVGDSRYPVWSPDGQRIAFESSAVASELLPAPLLDANLRDDIYVKNIRTGLVQLVSIRSDLKQGNSSSDLFYVRGVSSNVWTPDGRALLFMSASTNFSASTSNGFGDDLFLKSL